MPGLQPRPLLEAASFVLPAEDAIVSQRGSQPDSSQTIIHLGSGFPAWPGGPGEGGVSPSGPQVIVTSVLADPSLLSLSAQFPQGASAWPPTWGLFPSRNTSGPFILSPLPNLCKVPVETDQRRRFLSAVSEHSDSFSPGSFGKDKQGDLGLNPWCCTHMPEPLSWLGRPCEPQFPPL